MIKYILTSILLIALSGCFNKSPEPKLYGQENYSQFQLNIMFLREVGFVPVMADQSYQIVQYDSLQFFYKQYERELFDKGVVNWRESFDCNRYSLYYHALAQITYFKQSGGGRASSIAIGELYYVKKTGTGHAINFALTERGVVFIEPQNGKIVRLNRAEIDSIKYIKM